MAKKKTSSQAEKIVTDTKRKAPPAKSVSKKKPHRKAAKSKTAPKVGTEYENPVSSSAVTALISFCLFLLFVLIFKVKVDYVRNDLAVKKYFGSAWRIAGKPRQ